MVSEPPSGVRAARGIDRCAPGTRLDARRGVPERGSPTSRVSGRAELPVVGCPRRIPARAAAGLEARPGPDPAMRTDGRMTNPLAAVHHRCRVDDAVRAGADVRGTAIVVRTDTGQETTAKSAGRWKVSMNAHLGGPRRPMPELINNRRGAIGAAAGVRGEGDCGARTVAISATSTRSTHAYNRRSAASAPRISSVPTGTASPWAASIGRVSSRPWQCSGEIANATCPTACPTASIGSSRAGPGRIAAATAPMSVQTATSRTTDAEVRATGPPPSACAPILTAPDAAPTHAPRNCALGSVGDRTGTS